SSILFLFFFARLHPLYTLFPYTTLFRSGRVQQTYKHSVPRFFVPEHGTMFTLALVRFPPTATKEIQYLNAKGALVAVGGKRTSEIGRAVQQECRDRSRMPSSA